ncbi:MAG: alpha/beta fold hydrolase [Chloroflexota bacterium]|nr:MAG: alpha/beta fold hydrolase [Chloroflexota bacterium]
MRRGLFQLLVVGFTSFFFALIFNPTMQPGTRAEILLLDRNHSAVTRIVDGDTVQVKASLPMKVSQDTQVNLYLDSLPEPLPGCVIPANQLSCETEPFIALGWYWNPDGTPALERRLQADISGEVIASSPSVQVAARPVIMVHGFSSTWEAWANYLGPDGYLAEFGVQGFAVGDGQVEGTMNTGRIDDPTGRTNTIAENAAIVGDYIQRVKQLTGAQQVDLMAHSMGGLISRYYIARVMGKRDVAQLIMLGSPMAGTDCANLPASLGYYLPATLEIQPRYVIDIFNQQITHRKGVPFHALAGVPILEQVQSPCTRVPTDLAVSRESVSAIDLDMVEMSILHTELNTSRQVFEGYVFPLLQAQSSAYLASPDQQLSGTATEALQFTRVYTGHLDQGGNQEIVIPIDANVTVANFALFDASRSITVTVQGASGNVITLDPLTNGVVVIDNPETMVYLGYGFQNPRAGAWKVTLHPTDSTPPGGADYAITASLAGGVSLQAAANTLLPEIGEPVEITARLEAAGQSIRVDSVQARVIDGDGAIQQLELIEKSGSYQTIWEPSSPGIYAIAIQLTGSTLDGLAVERSTYLSVQAQQAPNRSRVILISAAIILVVLVLAGGIIVGLGLLGIRLIYRWRTHAL